MSRQFTTEYLLEVARGNIAGASCVSKFGRNGAIAATNTEEIWTVSSDRTTLSVAATLEAISTDIDDSGSGGSNPASTGAQIITVEGINNSWAEVSEDITLDGTTASSATSASFFRVNRAFVKQTGTYRGSNEGTITIRVSSAGSTQAQIEIGKGQTEQTHYTVPTGKKLYLLTGYLSNDAATNRNVDSELYQYTGVDDVATSFVGARRKVFGVTGVSAGGHFQHRWLDPVEIAGPADLVWFATAPAGGAVGVEAGFDGVLITD